MILRALLSGRPQLGGRRRVDLAVDDDDPVALARCGDRDLAVEDVLQHSGGIALERVAEAAASGETRA